MVEDKKEDPVEKAIELAKPILSQIGFGTVMGYCSGYAAKKIGKAIAFGIGVLFVSLQVAASTGYIQVDWMKIKDDTMKKFDQDGDGKVDAEDLKLYWRKAKSILVNRLPSSGGFGLGALYGLKHG